MRATNRRKVFCIKRIPKRVSLRARPLYAHHGNHRFLGCRLIALAIIGKIVKSGHKSSILCKRCSFAIAHFLTTFIMEITVGMVDRSIPASILIQRT